LKDGRTVLSFPLEDNERPAIPSEKHPAFTILEGLAFQFLQENQAEKRIELQQDNEGRDCYSVAFITRGERGAVVIQPEHPGNIELPQAAKTNIEKHGITHI